MSNRLGRWAGGRVTRRKDGTKVWHIDKMIRGHHYRFVIGTGPKEPVGALDRFLEDPVRYLAALRADEERDRPVRIDVENVAAFLDHLQKRGRTLQYRQNVHYYLMQWHDVIGSRDLRAVTTAELKQWLLRWGTAERHRIIAIKSFAGFLRTGLHILSVDQDPTANLRVPQAVPEKSVRRKGHTIEEIEAAYRHIRAQDVRDVLCIRAKTGMHEKEVGRIGMGDAELRRVDGGEIVGTVTFLHKSGERHTQSLDAQAFAAASRLLGQLPKGVDNKRQHRELARAAKALTAALRESDPTARDVPPLRPGELRHSFATWARTAGRVVRATDAGVPLDLIAEVIGHKSAATTRRFYDSTEVPPMIVIPLRLVHPHDPRYS